MDSASSSPTAIEIVWRSPWVRAGTYVLLSVLIVMVLWGLRTQYAFALQVGVIGFVIAYILNPVVNTLQRVRVGRGLSVILIYLIVFLLIVFLSTLLTQVVVELGRFVNLIPSAIESGGAMLARLGGWVEGWTENLPSFLSERFGTNDGQDLSMQFQEQLTLMLENAAGSLLTALQGLVKEGPSALLMGATSVIGVAFQVFLILTTSAYFLYDFPRFTRNFERFIPTRWKPLANDLITKTDQAVGGYLRGQLLITALLGFLIWIGLSLIGVPLATAISFLAALFNLVPYLGPIVGAVPAILLGLTVGPWTPVFAIAIFVAANQLEAHVLSPWILSKNVDLHPVTVMLAILAGAGLLGFLGALLAVPIVALAKVLAEEYVLTLPAYATSDAPGDMKDSTAP